jgi:hypothetical protein
MNLRMHRTKADYDTNTKISIQDAKTSLKMAQSVIEELVERSSNNITD